MARRNGSPDAFFTLIGIPILNVTMERALDIIDTEIAEGTPALDCREIHFVNAHCINVAVGSESYRSILAGARAVYADGSGIRKAGEMLGTPIVDNVNGTDLFPLLCRRFAETGRKIYLLGAAPGIAEKTADWVRTNIGPGIIAGYRDGFFSPEENEAVVVQINRTAPDLLLCGMGVPRQELWLHGQRERLEVPACMGVGGLFDFYSGTIPRAPRWMRRVGIEWVWRLMMEPRRMWKRYIIGNVRFLLLIRAIRRNAEAWQHRRPNRKES